MLVKILDEFGEIPERSGQPIDLVDDDDIDLPALHGLQQFRQTGSIEIAAGIPTVVVVARRELPSFVRLTADIGPTGFALSIERIEILLQPTVGRHAGVNRAPQRLAFLDLGSATVPS